MKIVKFIKKNSFVLLLLILLLIVEIVLTSINPIIGCDLFFRNDFELTQEKHPEKVWDKVLFGSSVVTASYIEEQSNSGYINCGVDYGTVSDIYTMLKKKDIILGSELVIALNDISFMDELDTNKTYIWHKKWYEPYIYFERDRFGPFISDAIKNLLNFKPPVTTRFDTQQKVVYYGALSDEELKTSEKGMLERFGSLSYEDCKANYEDLQRLIDFCSKNDIRLRAIWMPWNDKIQIYPAAQEIMDEANRILADNGIEVYDMLSCVDSDKFYDIGHLDYNTGAPYFTSLFDEWAAH